ncbi:MAG: GAF domain-containing protein [Deltaproteobacteria bacterium]|nr:GAF domain-containing protein [Deltaproteobacteria bacterium]
MNKLLFWRRLSKRSTPGGVDPASLAAGENEAAIHRIEKRIWQLALLAVVVILYLTLSVIGLQLLDYFDPGKGGAGLREAQTVDPLLYPLSLGVLVLLFSAYLVIQQRQLLRTSRQLFSERQTTSELNRSVDILSALLEVSSSINAQKRIMTILTTISRAVRDSFQADRVSVMLVDRSGKNLKTMAAIGKAEEKVRDVFVPLGQGVAGWVVRHGQPLLLQGKADPAAFPGTVDKNGEISSAMCVPLKIGQRCIGVLNVNRMGRHSEFTANDLRLLSVFGNNAATAINNALLHHRRKEQIRLRTVVEQLHSPRVVHELIDKAEQFVAPGGLRERRTISTLFADIRGFSEMSALIDPETMVAFLDAFYARMAQAVADNEGTLDKFIGDEVMAFFGAPEPLENVSLNALQTAVEMMIFFGWLRESFSLRQPQFSRVGLGIGINTGPVVVGIVGSRQRSEYTVIGDAVNLARRLCGHARSGEILVGEATRQQASDEVCCHFVGEIEFKGFSSAKPVYRIEWQ